LSWREGSIFLVYENTKSITISLPPVLSSKKLNGKKTAVKSIRKIYSGVGSGFNVNLFMIFALKNYFWR